MFQAMHGPRGSRLRQEWPLRRGRRSHGARTALISSMPPCLFPDVMQLIRVTVAPAGEYVTLAGFILSQLNEIPKPGDHFRWSGWRFEVVDMDGRRIDMVLVQRQPDL